jgi:hypothetical protein
VSAAADSWTTAHLVSLMSDWRTSDKGNHWAVIDGYFVCVYRRSLADGEWWGALFKPEDTDERVKPTFVLGTFPNARKAKDAALKELGEHLAHQWRALSRMAP